jgi:hypothetical protein
MTRAGQPPRTLLDREYPHQILVLAENVGGKTFDKVSDFHAKLGITRKSRSVRKYDAWYSLYYFADREHAKLFQAMFGGEPLIPGTCPRIRGAPLRMNVSWRGDTVRVVTHLGEKPAGRGSICRRGR